MPYHKILPVIAYSEFLSRVAKETHYTSSRGQRYLIKRLTGDVLHIERLDAKSNRDCAIELKDLYRAYVELEDYATENFRPYVPRKHSPARGLLLRLGLIG